MIWFQELQTRKKLSRIFSSYEKTFPADERRDEAQFLALLENPNSLIFIIKNEENSIGYVILWELNDFYLQEKFGNMILESEPSDWNEMAERRINFYVRNGYSIVSKEYVQPSYGEGKKELKLFLLGNFKVENLMAVEFELRSKVYDSI